MLPGTTIVSIGHRSALQSLRQRHLTLQADGDRAQPRKGSLTPAGA
jgi:ABC-type uncharacterized transport system fused permease/ATPase subunit